MAEIKGLKQHAENLQQRKWANVPADVKADMQEFANFAIENNLTDEQIISLVSVLPAQYAEMLVKLLPEEQYKKLDAQLIDMYTHNFKCMNAKQPCTKIVPISQYRRQMEQENSDTLETSRFITRYELLMVACGLGCLPFALLVKEEFDSPILNNLKREYDKKHTDHYVRAEMSLLNDILPTQMRQCLEQAKLTGLDVD